MITSSHPIQFVIRYAQVTYKKFSQNVCSPSNGKLFSNLLARFVPKLTGRKSLTSIHTDTGVQNFAGLWCVFIAQTLEAA